jgi:signal recognition particle receptor subunit beta
MRRTPYNVLVKIIVCGNMMSGKTRICRAISGEDSENDKYEPTVGLDLFSIPRSLSENRECKVHLMDTSGDRHYLAIIRSYFPACAMVIIVVDMKKGQTLEHVRDWIDESRESSKSKALGRKSVPMAIFANKSGKGMNDSKLIDLCKEEDVLLFEIDFNNQAEIINAFDTVLCYIDSKILRHCDSHPGVRYVGLRGADYGESEPLIGRRHRAPSTQGCCSIL